MQRKSYGDTDFVTGLRAVAAFGVLLIHSGGGGLRELGQIGNNLVDLGRTGVYVFFVISGFSVVASFQGDHRDYLAKRFLRLAPLYYFWIAVAIAMKGTLPDTRNILLHVAFLGFLDHTVTNSILGVEWSISIEAFWYLVVPFLLTFATTRLHIAVLLLASFAWYAFCQEVPFIPADSPAPAMHWSPFPYAICYVLGVAAFRLRPHWAGRYSGAAFGASALALVVFVVRPEVVTRLFRDELLLVSFATFAVLCFGSTQGVPGRLLANRWMLHLGTISYGIYLSHPIVLHVLRLLQVPGHDVGPVRLLYAGVGAAMVSTLTYRWIELPFLRSRRTAAWPARRDSNPRPAA